MLVQRGYPEAVGLGLPEPEFWEDGFSFVITFRSIAPREGVAPTPDAFRALLEQREITDRLDRGLLHAREHGTIARREYVAVTGVSERTAANDLADLVRKGLLEATGGRGRRTAYRLRHEAG